MKRNRTIALLVGITCLYLFTLYTTNKSIFSYVFNPDLIHKYYLSQDIPHEVAGKRLFLSDTEIYLASGYLYANGLDPTKINFDHPPLIKYLYGISILLFMTPFPIEIGFGIMILSLSFLLGRKIFKNWQIPTFACLILIIDPLFLDMTALPLLDFGQTAFMLLYLFTILFYRRNILLVGLTLGLFAASKSWITPVYFLIVISAFQIYKKEFNLKNMMSQIMIAFVIYCSFYLITFVNNAGRFNIFFFILKTIKYRLEHNFTPFIGSSVILFLTGYAKTWWGNQEFIRSNVWTILWPIGLMITIRNIFLPNIKKIDQKKLLAILSVGYLLFLLTQSPFPRYFIIILPFIYLNLSDFIYSKFKSS
ncbi:hypothetical protein A3C23_04055 [Candidatus Roizmanbacteria bacterium RIFCSPHIGHO2_02_FULL_37_13b]|uniref:Glycosyltransferase RgtA/B/C/D-like domain-containing protein n=1 Tax=Candidatus Roizmanbacteria bacterium RIFCSPLOWO2_02_FULL_36_11 TaxID=1802071 RepID=A0A1F7JH02_9BACT|nr:MAG: hypothetical protein A3C23_04055 [Candidatus Roizmanbacteria bacterium RIFCSPHIGHO2_02_FULL_37_13b]OGK54891.1 MAG: hypothetical protein A3H78_00205 [Candidatus Roizmanbacteria bacterium RIFCSPLOWO2_02_FULL_36_11]